MKNKLRKILSIIIASATILTTACSTNSGEEVLQFIEEGSQDYLELAEPLLAADNQQESQILLDYLAMKFSQNDTMTEPINDKLKETLSLCDEPLVKDAVEKIIEESSEDKKERLTQGFNVIKHMSTHRENSTGEAILKTTADIVKDEKGWDLEYRVLTESDFNKEFEDYVWSTQDQAEVERRKQIYSKLQEFIKGIFQEQ